MTIEMKDETAKNAVYMEYYIKGRRDCAWGNPSKEYQPEAYYKGYSDQYEREQRATYESMREEALRNRPGE